MKKKKRRFVIFVIIALLLGAFVFNIFIQKEKYNYDNMSLLYEYKPVCYGIEYTHRSTKYLSDGEAIPFSQKYCIGFLVIRQEERLFYRQLDSK